MAYVTSVDDSSTSFSLTTERFLRVSSRYLLAAVQTESVLVREYSDCYPVGEFVDPPAFRSAAMQGAARHLSQVFHQLEARS